MRIEENRDFFNLFFFSGVAWYGRGSHCMYAEVKKHHGFEVCSLIFLHLLKLFLIFIGVLVIFLFSDRKHSKGFYMFVFLTGFV